MPSDGPLTLRELAQRGLGDFSSIGPKRVAAFAQAGVHNVADLLTFYPRRWVDRTTEASVRDAREGTEALVVGEVRSVSSPPARGRGPRRVVATLGDGTGRLALTFFNQPWRERQLKPGMLVAVFGKVGRFQGTKQMTNPAVDVLGDPDERPRPIVPIYPQSEKIDLPSWTILKAVEEALRRASARGLADPVPDVVLDRLDLQSRGAAIRGIHLPESMREKEAARRRLAFDELLRVQLVLVMRKRVLEHESVGFRHVVGGELQQRFLARLPYPLTGAQRRVIGEIEADLAAPVPMHRLLQGDVGAGKTVVAVAALLDAVAGGHQGALMAPTEVLAEQHHLGVRHLLDGLMVPDAGATLFADRPLSVALLTNRVTGTERRAVLAGLADGSVDLVIGTHALIQEGVTFHSLGVVVVDEQHRFGVEQRAALRAKGEDGAGAVPDVLVMTATPIPRTAAMTVYGDLDVSVLDELPPGRTPIRTRWAEGPLAEAEVWAAVREAVDEGRQAYVVTPLIEESDKLQVASAQETFDRLSAGELRGLRLGLLHGRLAGAEKEAVMEQFRQGTIDVLVATTVIEVGVDVPNATVMVVLDADRFGIAQLHQLRGRVGRGAHASTCWLVTTPDPEHPGAPSPRVEALVASTDGFELAEVDLELRGEGTIMGAAQKGRTDLKLASLRRDRELVELARAVAEELVSPDGRLDALPDLADEVGLFLTAEDEEFLTKS
jgi:ATP-dependent DNA helicase RecG